MTRFHSTLQAKQHHASQQICPPQRKQSEKYTINGPLYDYYRLSAGAVSCEPVAVSAAAQEFFQFGPGLTNHGRYRSGIASEFNNPATPLADQDASLSRSERRTVLDLDYIVENLRRERYTKTMRGNRRRTMDHRLFQRAYHMVHGLLPVQVRRQLQRIYLKNWKTLSFPTWPVDFTVDLLHEEALRHSMLTTGQRKIPFIWFWPEGAKSCLIMTHDVETRRGRDFASALIDLDDSYGFKSSFQSIPERRYTIPDDYAQEIRSRGCEFNIHDLNNDGSLFRDRGEFLRRAEKINAYARKYKARGFRSGAGYRNQEWFDAFDFSYDMSVPNVAHLESQRGGCCTVMPHFIGNVLELPLTTVEDYSLVHILKEDTIDLWKRQINLIHGRNGLITFNAHPDYICSRRVHRLYEALLDYLGDLAAREYIWSPLPRDVDRWWRARRQMRLVKSGYDWEIEGPQADRARLAYAVLDEADSLTYEIVL